MYIAHAPAARQGQGMLFVDPLTRARHPPPEILLQGFLAAYTAEDDDVAPGLDITQDFHIQIPACTLTKPREVGQNLLKFSHL
jgi:hypothetical protein